MITVHNPHPRLVNVALGNGKFTRVLPLGDAEVDQKLVQRLLDTKELVQKEGSKDAAEAEAKAAADNKRGGRVALADVK